MTNPLVESTALPHSLAYVPPRLLLVDDNPAVLSTLSAVLEYNCFRVVTASTVNQALQLMTQQTFDVLVSDLHMPGAGDGLTVVSAMRHANPAAVTFIFSGYPEMQEAADAIRRQPDEILAKPLNPGALVGAIRSRLAQVKPAGSKVENVANVLEAQANTTIHEWLALVEAEPSIPHGLSRAERSAHLPELFRNLVTRLRNPLPLGTKAFVSEAAALHGQTRRRQGYTAAMMVEESRMLQVSIFQTLQNNLHQLDFSLLLLGVMAIADEVDSQLAQMMAAYVKESEADELPRPGLWSPPGKA